MTGRDRDMEALADALYEAGRGAQDVRRVTLPHALAIGMGRLLVRPAVLAPALFSVAAGVLLARTGVDVGSLLMPMVWAGPFIVVAVASFVAHAWRQNSTTPVYGVGQEVGQAEPGQVANRVVQASQPAQDAEVGQVARVANPAPPATVTVTVLPDAEERLAGSPHLISAIRRLRKRQELAIAVSQTTETEQAETKEEIA